ncbi:MAG: hypothetical protein AB7K52_03590 [Phycisphaerales bacterium]
MSRSNRQDASKFGSSGKPEASPLVLVVSANSDRRATLASAMRRDNLSCAFADSTEAARTLVRARVARGNESPFEAVLVDLPSCTASALRLVRELGERHIPAVLVCPNVSFDEAVEAMRAGAADIVTTMGVLPTEIGRRVRSAMAQRRAELAADGEVLAQSAAHAAAADYGDVPAAPAETTSVPTAARSKRSAKGDDDLSARAGDTHALAERFARQIRAELDVETLLREVLEFILVHVGPTNAAVFLPGQTGDYSLGAYVNYTCPKDAAEVLLDHLANVAAPRLESTMGVLHLRRVEQLREHVGDGAPWLEDSHMLAFTCRNEGECLAVFTLFRDRANPFNAQIRPLLQRVSEVFGGQLARVVRIHHRHLPREKWGALGDPPAADDEGGLAA